MARSDAVSFGLREGHFDSPVEKMKFIQSWSGGIRAFPVLM